MKKSFLLVAITGLCWLVVHGAGARLPVLDEPIILLETDSNLQLTRSTETSIAMDSANTVHLVYFLQDESTSVPDNQIWYQQIGDAILPPERVDSGPLGGGRHPSMVLDISENPFVVWQDYRHSTEENRWIDNLEIYADRRTNGMFRENDIRITESQADHIGDNGFVPQAHASDDGSLSVVWYDFHRTGTASELYFRQSDEFGDFGEENTVSNFLLLEASNPDTGTYWMPTLTSIGNELLLLWGFRPGFAGFFQLQDMRVTRLGTTEPQIVAENAGSFLDPPRLASNGMGAIAMVYTTPEGSATQIYIRMRAEDGTWSAPVQCSHPDFPATQPALAIHPQGTIAVAWQEDTGDQSIIQLALFSPELERIDTATLGESEANSRTPAITISPLGSMALMWIETTDTTRRLVLQREQSTSVPSWSLHE